MTLETIAQRLDLVLARLDAAPPKRWLTIGEAVAVSGVSEEGLRRLIRQGRLRLHRPTPRRVVIDREELDRVILES